MSDDRLPFDHEPIDSAYIERCERAKSTLVRNRNLKEIMRLLDLASGFGPKRPLKTLAALLYIDEDPTHRDPFFEPEVPGLRKKGWNRLQNILRGHSGVTEREAGYFHAALRVGFGDEWADAITPEAFATMSASAFFREAQGLSLPWPEEGIAPSLAFEALSALDQGLAIAPAFLDTDRLGVIPNSRNAHLRTEEVELVYSPGSRYVLHVRGLAPNQEQFVVFELSDAPLSFEGENEPFVGFPVAARVATERNASIRPETAPGFEISSAYGGFAFFALTAPVDCDLEDVLQINLCAERWNANEVEGLARRLRLLRLERPDEIRLARHAYRVAG